MLVQHWMTRDVVTVEADTPFLEARLTLKDKQIRHLPVVDHGKLIGVVTDRDLKEAAPSGATTLDVYEMNYLLLKMKVRDLPGVGACAPRLPPGSAKPGHVRPPHPPRLPRLRHPGEGRGGRGPRPGDQGEVRGRGKHIPAAAIQGGPRTCC